MKLSCYFFFGGLYVYCKAGTQGIKSSSQNDVGTGTGSEINHAGLSRRRVSAHPGC